MLSVNFNAYASYVTDSLYQWDINQDLVISGLGLSVAPEIHFANADMDRAIVRQSTLESGVVTVCIPNSLLQAALTIKAYVGIYEDETFKIIETIEIPVIAKTRPSDYTLEDTDEEIYSFKALENKISDLTSPDGKNAVIRLKDTNGGKDLTVWIGTRAQYDAIETPVKNCLYIITDDTTQEDYGKAIEAAIKAAEEAKAKMNWIDVTDKITGFDAISKPDGVEYIYESHQARYSPSAGIVFFSLSFMVIGNFKKWDTLKIAPRGQYGKSANSRTVLQCRETRLSAEYYGGVSNSEIAITANEDISDINPMQYISGWYFCNGE